MKEPEWTRKICKQLQDAGCIVFVAAGNKYGTVGWPDRYVIYDGGLSWWLEFKTADGKLSLLQQVVMKSIARRGVCAYVVRMPGSVETWDGKSLGTFDGNGKSLLTFLLGNL